MDSIIFDLDGTLWDPIDTVLAAWNSRMHELQVKREPLTRMEFAGTMGLQMDEISRQFFPGLADEERRQIVNQCCRFEQTMLKERGGHLYADVEQVLEILSLRYKLYIVSNCEDGYIESLYHFHGLNRYFSDYENPGRTGLSKGGNINLIMERNNLLSPIYVGDTEGDLVAARYAGIPFVYASYGFGSVHEYEHRIETFADLLDIR
ncbi:MULTISPECIES: HAD family hydrolase [Exiguobacterium]|uniref:HAD family hydrolase n=1 Tax=Exiguobacterium TaxID=33986 RepID=UPI001BE9C39E|nr:MULTISPECIES: HAD family hydrolase [Exiguobacterium]MCT4776795.1 HAD family hydrolase [Exiguobacterium aquaticum]MCT4790119.1 HAD family hydrolase [Exiguobacterium mexicanum]